MNKIYLILCAWIVVFTGCGPSYTELNGSIFLVSKDGISYKLGLTSVAALRKEEFKSLESSCIEMQNDFIAPSINVETLDPAIDAGEIATARIDAAGLDTVMTNSFGFGGTNGSMLMSKYWE